MTKRLCQDSACRSNSICLDPQIELGELKYKAKLLNDYLKVGIIWSHPTGRIVETNPFITKLTGYRSKELEGCIFFDLFHQDHNKPQLDPATTTGIVEDMCVALKHKDGMRIWTRLTAIPARNLHMRYLLLLLEPMNTAPDLETASESKTPKTRFQRFAGIIGKSRQIERLCKISSKAARSECTVLIQGASGTGKEIFADAIQKHSRRARHPYVRVNCVAISETLLESELFGHVKGAFTGAIRDRKGRFRQGNNGTILLDEIGSMSLAGQAKLLRVLQEREFEPVGSSRTIQCDVRIIATTNVDLKKAVQKGRFREDLYYRLSVLTIKLPPLRERKEDIPLLAQYFLQTFADRTQKKIFDFHPETMSVLLNYDWPGNIRELKNIIEHIVVLSEDGYILPSILPKHLVEPNVNEKAAPSNEMSLRHRLDIYERKILQQTLHDTNWVKKRAARQLGIDPRNFNYFLRKHRIICKSVQEEY